MVSNYIDALKFIIEIVILWFVFYMLLLFIKGTRAVQVLKGIIILVIIFLISKELQLETINWILGKLFTISVIAFVIIFQPELRRGLARIGQFGMFSRQQETLDEIVKAALVLSKKKIGALIAIEREIGLRPYIESGIKMDSIVTSEVLNTIFAPNTPLHDGGVVVQGSIIASAGCLFPLTQNPHVSSSVGTRHRAAMGLSEETDAVVVVVSEETGDISISVGGRLTRHLDEKEFGRVLSNIFRPKKSKKSIFDFWNKIVSRMVSTTKGE
ncbi:MAG: TIGR00159 family protein [Candidatus Omnitrophica bacterium]|nr:TIGR00159 family protein [Candidatus Omnitrophota bacterium]